MQRYFRLPLNDPPILGGTGSYEVVRPVTEWTQVSHRWLLLWLWHDGLLSINGVVHPFSNGTVFVVPPKSRCRLEYTTGKDPTQFWSHFQPCEDTTNPVAIPLQTYLGGRQAAFEREALRSMDWFAYSPRYVRALVWSLLWSICEDISEVRESVFVEKAEEIIRARLSESVRVSEIAEELQISHNQLTRLFRMEHGMTVQEFIRNYRVSTATRLLISTTLPIKQIAASVGMPDQRIFNRFIKDSLGMPPTQVRAERSSFDLNQFSGTEDYREAIRSRRTIPVVSTSK